VIAARGVSLLVLFGAGLFACGGEPSIPAQGPTAAPAEAATSSAGGSSVFRSKRFSMVLHLPGGAREWRVDDHSAPEIVATQAPPGARVVAARWAEPELQNRATCEALARRRGLLPPPSLAVVEESTETRADGHDVRVWVAIEPGPTEASPIRGHAMAVGARARWCWAVHYATEVPSAKDASELSSRLARVRQQTLAKVEIDGIEAIERAARSR
jgi:hypothetical protein